MGAALGAAGSSSALGAAGSSPALGAPPAARDGKGPADAPRVAPALAENPAGDRSGDAMAPVSLAACDLERGRDPRPRARGCRGRLVTVHPGNRRAVYPGPGAPEVPFGAAAVTVRVPGSPDLLAVGDLDADGHCDVVHGTLGSPALRLHRGNGRGGLGLLHETVLPGTLTALAFGRLDDDAWSDLAIGSGDEVLVVRGRDRSGEPRRTDRRSVPSAIRSMALAGFAAGEGRPVAAALLEDGDVVVRERGALRVRPLGERVSDARGASLRAARVRGGAGDDLLVLDVEQHRVRAAGDPSWDIALPGRPVAALPLRLDADARATSSCSPRGGRCRSRS